MLFVCQPKVGLEVGPSAGGRRFGTPLAAGSGKESSGLDDGHTSADGARLGDGVSPFLSKFTAGGQLSEDGFDGGRRAPGSGDAHKIRCEHVVVDVTVGGPEMSEEDEGGGVTIA